MKALIKLAVLLLSCVAIGGCWDRTELNDLAIVTGLAFDKTENNQILISAQIFIPKSQKADSSGAGGGAEKKTFVRFEQGSNTADALSKLQRKNPRKLFWGHCKVFIFSDALAKSGIREQLDFLLRHPQPRERAFMFVSKGKAADALKLTPPVERTSAEVLRELAKNKTGIEVNVEQLSIMLKGLSQAAIIPKIEILPPEEAEEATHTIPYVVGTAIFKKDKMVGEISEKVTRGVMWVRNEIEEYTVTYKPEGDPGNISLNPVRADVKLIPAIKGNRWLMTVKVRTEGDIVENGTLLNPMNPALLANMEQAFKDDIEGRIQLALHEVQHGLKVDIFDFAEVFYRQYPVQWEKTKDHWNEIFPMIEVRTEIEAHILRTGLTNLPGGIPEEEVRTE